MTRPMREKNKNFAACSLVRDRPVKNDLQASVTNSPDAILDAQTLALRDSIGFVATATGLCENSKRGDEPSDFAKSNEES